MHRRTTVVLALTLLLFSIPAFGYDYEYEEFWIHQGTFTIGNGERAEIGSFTVRNYAPEGEGFRLLLYRNSDYVDDFYLDDFSINEYIYDNFLKISVKSISDGTITINAFQHEFEKVWIFRERHRIGIGGTVDYDGASVELLELNETRALLKTTYGSEEKEDSFGIRDVKKYDAIKVRLTFIDANSAVIELYTPGEPGFEILATNLSDSYLCNETINAEIFVKNTGEIPLRGVNLEGSLDFGNLFPDSFQTTIIEPGKSKKAIFEIKPEISPVEKDVKLDLAAVGYDYLGKEETAEKSLTTSIEPFIAIIKEHEGTNLSLENIDESILGIGLTVNNCAPSGTSVHIKDEIPDSFLLIDQDSPEWDLIIPAGSSQRIEYTIAATEPGNYTLPSATAEFEYEGSSYESISDIPQYVLVEGTRVEISKSSNVEYAQEGDIVRITVIATNVGTTEAAVEIADEIPAGIDFVSGETSWTGSLEPQQIRTLKYMIVADDNDFQLPAAKLSYKSDDTSGEERSNTLTIHSGEAPAEDAEDRPEAQQMGRLGITGFLFKVYLAVFSIIIIGPLGVYIYINQKTLK